MFSIFQDDFMPNFWGMHSEYVILFHFHVGSDEKVSHLPIRPQSLGCTFIQNLENI